MGRSLLAASLFTPLLTIANPSIFTNWVQNPACSTPTGLIDISVTGGTAPYTFLWNTLVTTEDVYGLGPGYYEVTVTDAMGLQATQNWTLVPTVLMSPSSAQDGHANCIEQTMGGEVQVIEWGINGQAPYTYNPPPVGVDPQGDPYFYFPFATPGSTVTIDVTDANGCTGTLYEPIVIPQPVGGPNMVLQNVQGSCSGGSGGAATITNLFDGNWFSAPTLKLYDANYALLSELYNVSNTVTMPDLAPGHYIVGRDWNFFQQYTAFPCAGSDTLGFDIVDLGLACGTVSGDVFIDNDGDCTQDVTEASVPYDVLEILPGPLYAITDADGHYSLDIADGSYTMQQDNATLSQLCPVTVPVPFTMAGNALAIDLADSSLVPLDLAINVSSSAMRTGIGGTIWMNARNMSAQVSGAVTVTLQLDNTLVYGSAFPVPDGITGNLLTWDLAAFTAYQQQNFTIAVQVPIGTPLGTPLLSIASVSNTMADALVDNNYSSLNGVVVGAFDPNTKSVVAKPGEVDGIYFIDLDDHLDYEIHFQNTGNAPALDVVVTDTLSDALDMGTFEQGAASHPFTVSFLPGRVVQWTFVNINLPDSTADFLGSQGSVTFRIKPKADVEPGVPIDNTANIYFDQNEPVITSTASIVPEFSVGVRTVAPDAGMKLWPDPASTELHVNLGASAVTNLRITTMDGRVVRRVAVHGVLVDLDIQDIRTGLYVLEAENGAGVIGRERFVKQ